MSGIQASTFSMSKVEAGAVVTVAAGRFVVPEDVAHAWRSGI